MQPNETPNVPAQPVQSEPIAPINPTPGIAMAPNYNTEPETTVEPGTEQAPQTPQTPANPTEQAQPTQPIEPTTPVAPVQPQQQTPVTPTQPTQTYEEYVNSLMQDIPDVDLPKPSDVPENDPDALVKFFDDFGQKIVEKAQNEAARNNRFQQIEAQAWRDAFTKYPELQKNQQLRDTIHNIRVGAFAQGNSLSPTQVADGFFGTIGQEYKRGVNDTNVQTRTVEAQPLNGGGVTPPAPTVNYEALQDGGVNEAVNQIQRLMDAGLL